MALRRLGDWAAGCDGDHQGAGSCFPAGAPPRGPADLAAFAWRASGLVLRCALWGRRTVGACLGPAGGLVARLSSGVLWEEIWRWTGAKALNWGFIGWLALFFFLTAVLAGVLGGTREGSGHHSLLIDVLWRIVWTLNGLALVALLFLVIAVGIQALVRRLRPGS